MQILLMIHFFVIFQAKSKFQDVFNQISTQLNLRENEYFGLAQKKGNQYELIVFV